MNFKSLAHPRFRKYVSLGIFPKLLLAPAALLILIFFCLAKPFVQFRLYRMVDSRIGHLATNTEIIRLQTLKHNQTASKKEILVYCSENRNCSNNALRRLFFRKSLHLKGHLAWLTLRGSSILKPFNSFASVGNQNLAVDQDGILARGFPLLEFSNDELLCGQNFLKRG